ncbi:MAG: heme-binding protein, partial [Mycobacterium sp.]
MLKRIATIAGQGLEGLGSVVGIRGGTEEPAYRSSPLTDGVEIREYGPRIAAQTTVLNSDVADSQAALSAGFRRLAGYIFGKNQSQTKIAMTAPVAQQPGEQIAMTAPVAQTPAPGGSVIRFFMPSEWTLATLPTPVDDTVELVEVPAETVAVLQFTGDRSPAAVAARTTELLNVLADKGIETSGTPFSWFYDPPWTLPFRRRNEVAVAVTP